MPNVLFVALEEMDCLEWLVGWVQSRPVPVTVSRAAHLESCGDASEASPPPALLIAPAGEQRQLEHFVASQKAYYQEAALTAIFVQLKNPGYGLLIQEWDRNGRTFTQRRCSLAQLQREIDTVLERCKVPAAVSEKIRGIGFYDCVVVGEHSLHVQTEVAGRSEPCIRTTVHREGAVISATVLPWPAGLHDLAAAEELVRARHQQVVERVRSGQEI